jgi:hypothetical protein
VGRRQTVVRGFDAGIRAGARAGQVTLLERSCGATPMRDMS